MEIVKNDLVLEFESEEIVLQDGLMKYHYPFPLFKFKHSLYTTFSFGFNKTFSFKNKRITFKRFANKVIVIFTFENDKKILNIYNNEIIGLAFSLRDIHEEDEMVTICRRIEVRRGSNYITFEDKEKKLKGHLSFLSSNLLLGTCLMRLIGVKNYENGVFDCIGIKRNTLVFPADSNKKKFYSFYIEDVINLLCIL